MAKPEEGFYCTSLFGLATRKPLVQIEVHHGGEVRDIQLSPDNAREFALNLLECAEAADMDAIVIRFLTERLGQKMEAAAAILSDFRELREGKP